MSRNVHIMRAEKLHRVNQIRPEFRRELLIAHARRTAGVNIECRNLSSCGGSPLAPQEFSPRKVVGENFPVNKSSTYVCRPAVESARPAHLIIPYVPSPARQSRFMQNFNPPRGKRLVNAARFFLLFLVARKTKTHAEAFFPRDADIYSLASMQRCSAMLAFPLCSCARYFELPARNSGWRALKINVIRRGGTRGIPSSCDLLIHLYGTRGEYRASRARPI